MNFNSLNGQANRNGPYFNPQFALNMYTRKSGEVVIHWGAEDRAKAIVTKLKESVNDSFVFIITKDQHPQWEKFLQELNLEGHVSYQMPYYVTNPVHGSMGRRLKVVLLQHPNHQQRLQGLNKGSA